jgi:hypothetical protein
MKIRWYCHGKGCHYDKHVPPRIKNEDICAIKVPKQLIPKPHVILNYMKQMEGVDKAYTPYISIKL